MTRKQSRIDHSCWRTWLAHTEIFRLLLRTMLGATLLTEVSLQTGLARWKDVNCKRSHQILKDRGDGIDLSRKRISSDWVCRYFKHPDIFINHGWWPGKKSITLFSALDIEDELHRCDWQTGRSALLLDRIVRPTGEKRHSSNWKHSSVMEYFRKNDP